MEASIVLRRLHNIVEFARQQKIANPRFRVVVDVGMERMYGFSQREIVRIIFGGILPNLPGLRNLDIAQARQIILAEEEMHPGGAGGLGVVEETINRTGANFGLTDQFMIFSFSPLPTCLRIQRINSETRRQELDEVNLDPTAGGRFTPLGIINEIPWEGKSKACEDWLFRGFDDNPYINDIRVRMPGITDAPYPHFESRENFDQMYVLGRAGFSIAQRLGLLGVDQPLADVVLGHDGHTAVFKFMTYRYFLEKYHDPEAALAATQKLCVATIHAPQTATIPRTIGEMVRRHFSEEEERDWGKFGEHWGKKTNALFIELNLSGRAGVVSEVHKMVTEAEGKAEGRSFASDAVKLLPDTVEADKLEVFPDTIDVETWLGAAVLEVLDKYLPDWRSRMTQLDQPAVIDPLRANLAFLHDFAAAIDIEDTWLMRLLHEGFSRLYQTPLSGREILLASLRRLTEYKTNLIKRFLDQHEQLEGIAQELNRPIFWLFGGIGHKDDIGANKQLSKLLGKIEEINSKQGLFRADFLLNYDLRKARWLFPGLALRGCWVGCTNPLDKRSQGTEAFGPSAIKSVMNGACLIGPDDGGATSLNYLPTVRVFGPRTRSGAISNHNDLWANEEIRRQSKLLMVNGFVGAFSDAARKIHADLIRFENNQGELAPGLHDKIIAVLTTIAHWNGRVLMDAYLGKTRK